MILGHPELGQLSLSEHSGVLTYNSDLNTWIFLSIFHYEYSTNPCIQPSIFLPNAQAFHKFQRLKSNQSRRL